MVFVEHYVISYSLKVSDALQGDQIRISLSHSSVHVWRSWHADQRVWQHISFLCLNGKINKMAPQIELSGVYMEFTV